MHEELSIEETNKLRESLGLKPIPISESQTSVLPNFKQNTSSTSNAANVINTTYVSNEKKTKNDVILLSIEETNKLRKSIGLKPIPLETTSETQLRHELLLDTKVGRGDKELKERILKAKKVTAQRNKPFNIHRNQHRDDQNETEIDTDSWLENLGSSKSGEINFEKEDLVSKVAANRRKENDLDAIIGHNKREVGNLLNNDILTLQDTEILDEDADDILINEKLVTEHKLQTSLKDRKEAEMLKFNGRHYTPVGEDDNEMSDIEDLSANTVIKRGKVIVSTQAANDSGKSSTVNSAKTNKKESTRNGFETVISFDNFDGEEGEDKDGFQGIRQTKEVKIKRIKRIKRSKPLDLSGKSSQSRRVFDPLQPPAERVEVDLEEVDDDYGALLNLNMQSRNKRRKKMSPEELAMLITASSKQDADKAGDSEKEGVSFVRGSHQYTEDTDWFLSKMELNLLSNGFVKEPEVESKNKNSNNDNNDNNDNNENNNDDNNNNTNLFDDLPSSSDGLVSEENDVKDLLSSTYNKSSVVSTSQMNDGAGMTNTNDKTDTIVAIENSSSMSSGTAFRKTANAAGMIVESGTEGKDVNESVDEKAKSGNTKIGEEVLHDDGPVFSGGLADTLKFLKTRKVIESTTQDEESSRKYREQIAKKQQMLAMKISIERRILEEELQKDKTYMKLSKIDRAEFFEKQLDRILKQKGIVSEESGRTSSNNYASSNDLKRSNAQYSKGTRNNLVNNKWRASAKARNDTKDDNGDSHGIVDLKNESYQPKITLNYKDDQGRALDTKQAYKHLSHKYHGTGLGKNSKGVWTKGRK